MKKLALGLLVTLLLAMLAYKPLAALAWGLLLMLLAALRR